MPGDALAACSCAEAELTICETARGFVPKLGDQRRRPGLTGWPSEISADAL